MPDTGLLQEAAALARRLAGDAMAWSLLGLAFADLEASVAGRGDRIEDLHCVRLPGLVYAAITGDAAAARPLAAALVMVHTGSELLDDVADGDLGPIWQGLSADAITLAAVTLCTTLSQLALSELDAPLEVVHAMQHTLARGLLAMAGGQARDIAQTGGANVRSIDAESAIAGKAGGALAMYAALGAHLAGAHAGTIAAYTEVGRSIGVAAQIRSECWDLLQAPFSRDLKAGTRTLPLTLYLERLDAGERDAFLRELDDARTDVEAQRRVRERVSASGAARTCALIIETHLQRVREALTTAQPRQPAGGELLAMASRYSLLERRIAGAIAAGATAPRASVLEAGR